MKLKPQPASRPRRPTRPARRTRERRSLLGRRRGASRPGTPLRRRIGARLPSLRRIIAGVGAVATASVLVALLNGPYLRVTEVAWAGEGYTAARDLRAALEPARGVSLLALDTRRLRERLEALPSVASASVHAGLDGRLEATLTEARATFVWITPTQRLLGAADGTIFAGDERSAPPDPALDGLPRIRDDRAEARFAGVGDVLPEQLLATALRLGELDPALLGSHARRLGVRLDDEYGFRLVADEPGWEVALGVFGVDPRESAAEAEERLERQLAAVRTLFAEHPEDGIGWVDVRNPGRVYFRAKG